MSWIEALILGLVQGLTEFLPVSSSGHLELGSALFGLTNPDDNLRFSIIVHGATVLSILVVFRKDIIAIIREVLRFQWNEETRFAALLLVSAIPVGIAGLLFEESIGSFFGGRVVFVGYMLLVTAGLLFLTRFATQEKKELTFLHAIIIGAAQTIAILPGISRSGATISMALFLGIDREKATRFSFLMVLVPIVGATFMEIRDLSAQSAGTDAVALTPLLTGFVAAFLSGLFACSWMIRLVKQGKIVYFSIYCLVVGLAAILTGVM
ncbi:MAG: undecaprenyl-diphosphate phosphatase [Bacteroidales bacterium]